MTGERPEAKGRGAHFNPPNRFGQIHAEDDLEHVEHDEDYLEDLRTLKTQYLPDESRTIVSKNDSPDLNFKYSLNPYRGCLHGWICWLIYPRSVNPFSRKDLRPDFSRIREGGR